MRVGTDVTRQSYSFSRPANTTAYTTGDLVANDASGASVVPISWANFCPNGSFYPAGIQLKKSGTSVTNASFRVHLFSASPTITAGVTSGDNAAFSSVVTGLSGYLGAFDGTMEVALADGCSTFCIPIEGVINGINLPQNPTLYALVEARAAYSPESAETFTAILSEENN